MAVGEFHRYTPRDFGHMNRIVSHWWTGMQLISLCFFPFLGVFAALHLFEPALVDGTRPLWWRVVSTGLGFVALAVIPLFVHWGARQVGRAAGWLGPTPENNGASNCVP